MLLMTAISTLLRRTPGSRNAIARLLSTQVSPQATLNVPKGSSVFQYGNAHRTGGGRAQPLLELADQAWTINHDERWAIVGAGKDRQILLDVSDTHP